MDSSTRLSITPKGEEEIQHRRHQLSIRKRRVLVSLEKPHTVEQILERTVFSEDEILDEINNLLQGGFIALDSQENARLAAQGKRDKDRDRFELDEEIVLSEAKYLLIDFCVDSFGTQAQTFSNGVRSCKTPEALGKYLRTIAEAAEKHCPERVPSLFKIIQEINETAR